MYRSASRVSVLGSSRHRDPGPVLLEGWGARHGAGVRHKERPLVSSLHMAHGGSEKASPLCCYGEYEKHYRSAQYLRNNPRKRFFEELLILVGWGAMAPCVHRCHIVTQSGGET